VFTVTVTLYNKGKRGKDAEVAEVTLELNALRNSEEAEEWFQLSGVTPIGEWVVPSSSPGSHTSVINWFQLIRVIESVLWLAGSHPSVSKVVPSSSAGSHTSVIKLFQLSGVTPIGELGIPAQLGHTHR
jgi:hypothetical protein